MTDMPGRNAMATTPMSRASTTTTAHCVTCCSDALPAGRHPESDPVFGFPVFARGLAPPCLEVRLEPEVRVVRLVEPPPEANPDLVLGPLAAVQASAAPSFHTEVECIVHAYRPSPRGRLPKAPGRSREPSHTGPRTRRNRIRTPMPSRAGLRCCSENPEIVTQLTGLFTLLSQRSRQPVRSAVDCCVKAHLRPFRIV